MPIRCIGGLCATIKVLSKARVLIGAGAVTKGVVGICLVVGIVTEGLVCIRMDVGFVAIGLVDIRMGVRAVTIESMGI